MRLRYKPEYSKILLEDDNNVQPIARKWNRVFCSKTDKPVGETIAPFSSSAAGGSAPPYRS